MKNTPDKDNPNQDKDNPNQLNQEVKLKSKIETNAITSKRTKNKSNFKLDYIFNNNKSRDIIFATWLQL